eukprot:3342879-Heterocapsa_arctica.AAC.1
MFGHAPGNYTNKDTGGIILLNKTIFELENIRAVETPSNELSGTGGSIWYKSGHFDLVIMFLHFPQITMMNKPDFVLIVNELVSWADSVINSHASSNVIIGSDLNYKHTKGDSWMKGLSAHFESTLMGKWTSMLPGPRGGELWRPPAETTEGNTRIGFMICNSSKDITTSRLIPTP